MIPLRYIVIAVILPICGHIILLSKKNRIPCVDNHELCESWGLNGECNKNPDYMLHWCNKTCHVC